MTLRTRWLRLPQVIDKTGMSRSVVYELIKEEGFPAPFQISGVKASLWLESEVEAWMQAAMEKARSLPLKGS